MSLHRTDVTYYGCRIWIEYEGKRPDEAEFIAYRIKRDFAGMLRTAGVDVRAHFNTYKEKMP